MKIREMSIEQLESLLEEKGDEIDELLQETIEDQIEILKKSAVKARENAEQYPHAHVGQKVTVQDIMDFFDGSKVKNVVKPKMNEEQAREYLGGQDEIVRPDTVEKDPVEGLSKGKKFRCKITCVDTGEEVWKFTSDLWQSFRSDVAQSEHKKSAKKRADEKKEEERKMLEDLIAQSAEEKGMTVDEYKEYLQNRKKEKGEDADAVAAD
jgi:hypothetical protein